MRGVPCRAAEPVARPKRRTGPDGDGAQRSRLELTRVRAGAYRTPDGRFGIEQESGRWVVLDAEQTDELGLPLVRGPFDTLDEVREAIGNVRSGPAPRSPLEARLKEAAARRRPASLAPDRRAARSRRQRQDADAGVRDTADAAPPSPPPIIVRRLDPGDESILRAAATDPRLVRRGVGLGSATAGREPAEASRPREADRTVLRRLLARADAHVLVALEGATLLGILSASELPAFGGGPAVLLVDEVASRDDRDARDIGRMLLDALLDLARERNVLRIDLLADPADPVVLGLLETRPGVRAAGERALFRFDPGKP